jgi:predicted DNA-binding protein
MKGYKEKTTGLLEKLRTEGDSKQLLSRTKNEAIERAGSTKEVLACCVALWRLLTSEYVSQHTGGLHMAYRLTKFIERALECCRDVVVAWEGVRREKKGQAAVQAAADDVVQAWSGVRRAALDGFRSFCERLSSGLVRDLNVSPCPDQSRSPGVRG